MLKVLSHRIKTHGGFQCLQPRPGTLVWRTPHGHVLIVDHTGTYPLGNDDLAQAFWNTAVQINTDIQGCPTPTREASNTAASKTDYLYRDDLDDVDWDYPLAC